MPNAPAPSDSAPNVGPSGRRHRHLIDTDFNGVESETLNALLRFRRLQLSVGGAGEVWIARDPDTGTLSLRAGFDSREAVATYVRECFRHVLPHCRYVLPHAPDEDLIDHQRRIAQALKYLRDNHESVSVTTRPDNAQFEFASVRGPRLLALWVETQAAPQAQAQPIRGRQTRLNLG